jgi:CRISPR/Cas system endoribonuclease Cas6 (RAMP superfamily)
MIGECVFFLRYEALSAEEDEQFQLLSPLVVSDEKEPTGSLEPAETSMNTGNPILI